MKVSFLGNRFHAEVVRIQSREANYGRIEILDKVAIAN